MKNAPQGGTHQIFQRSYTQKGKTDSDSQDPDLMVRA